MDKQPPAYQRVINHLKDAIREGRCNPDEKLPSESELMKQFDVSRITVTRALTELELTGTIYRVKGKGSFVASDKPELRRIISLILPHRADYFTGGQQYIHNIGNACRKRGYLLSVNYSEQSSRKERHILEDQLTHRVDGIILYPINNKNIKLISKLVLQNYPIVLLDRPLLELNLPTIRSDNFTGALEGVNSILEHNHRRIGFLGAMDSEAVKDRYKGYCRALLDRGIPVDPEIIIHRYPQEQRADEQELLESDAAEKVVDEFRSKGVTAVFCSNDLTAWQLYSASLRMGVRIPGELSIMGFDRLRHVKQLGLDLSSIAQDFKAIGEACVSLLVEAIEDGTAGKTGEIIIPTTLSPGGTVSPLARL